MVDVFRALLALLTYCAALSAAESIPSKPQKRHEVCPGATHFYSGKRPSWAKHMRVVCRIGSHVFLTDQPRKQ